MNLRLAQHYGMCFGVRDALAFTEQTALHQPITVLGQLVHNPVVSERLARLGTHQGSLDDTKSASTHTVVITAHGASDSHRDTWQKAGFEVADTTCPLVRRAHDALKRLVSAGWYPVVIGQKNHVEVRGLSGDFPDVIIVENEDDMVDLHGINRIGIVSQTTQPHTRVLTLVQTLKTRYPQAEVRFIDTVCQPTRRRQTAMENLAPMCDVILVIGGKNSNNTSQLTQTARDLAQAHTRVYQIERAADIRSEWLVGATEVGITAGTSTLEETVQEVMTYLQAAGGKRV